MASQKSTTVPQEEPVNLTTRILPINESRICNFRFNNPASQPFLGEWDLDLLGSIDSARFMEAASQILTTDIPVAFPTETVYGLGADATRSSAVRGIYKAKQRPADNPLIVHICSLHQLRNLLRPGSTTPDEDPSKWKDPIPTIYHPLISRFWPGPLTILLPLPDPSTLAPEVTNKLPTFGARMPASRLALALIRFTNTPLAAPSANASTRPSPTTAQHVLHDLNGRIEIILDAGPCGVGVESTVVDGLSDPPVILRPGGVGIEHLRQCEGWEMVQIGYKDGKEGEGKEREGPRAPGMKYKHYSPRARVVLMEFGTKRPSKAMLQEYLGLKNLVGIVRTKEWRAYGDDVRSNGATSKVERNNEQNRETYTPCLDLTEKVFRNANGTADISPSYDFRMPAPPPAISSAMYFQLSTDNDDAEAQPIGIWDINLSSDTATIARGLFSCLRELDQKDVDVIFVEGIDSTQGETAAAIMNRLRKAAEVEIRS